MGDEEAFMLIQNFYWCNKLFMRGILTIHHFWTDPLNKIKCMSHVKFHEHIHMEGTSSFFRFMLCGMKTRFSHFKVFSNFLVIFSFRNIPCRILCGWNWWAFNLKYVQGIRDDFVNMKNINFLKIIGNWVWTSSRSTISTVKHLWELL